LLLFLLLLLLLTALRNVFVERLTNREEELNLLLHNVRGLYSAEQEAVLGREFDLKLAVLLLHTHPALRNPANQTSLSLESCNVSRLHGILQGSKAFEAVTLAKTQLNNDPNNSSSSNSNNNSSSNISSSIRPVERRVIKARSHGHRTRVDDSMASSQAPLLLLRHKNGSHWLRHRRQSSFIADDDDDNDDLDVTSSALPSIDNCDVSALLRLLWENPTSSLPSNASASVLSHVTRRDEEIARMMTIANALHCAGIAILALLVLEVGHWVKVKAIKQF
jgi:hypothetical protein